ncbi:MAG: hypothetical protein ACI3ZY_10425 [Parabacteroides sp.]
MDWMELIGVVLVAVFVLWIVLLFLALYFLFACLQEQMDDEEDFLRGLGGKAWVLALLLLCSSCASHKESVPVVTIRDSLRIERLVAHPIEPRESILEAWMECDERGRVLLSKIEELEDDKLSLSLSLDSLGKMLVKARTSPDTVWVKADSVVVYRKEEVPVPVERKLTKWEQVRMRLGGISIVAMIVGIIYVVLWLIKKFRH